MSNFIREVEISATSVANGAEVELFSLRPGGMRRVTGWVRSDQELTLTLYQGKTAGGDWAAKATGTIPAGAAADGDGQDFDFILTGREVRLTLSNASGSTAAFEAEATLKGH